MCPHQLIKKHLLKKKIWKLRVGSPFHYFGDQRSVRAEAGSIGNILTRRVGIKERERVGVVDNCVNEEHVFGKVHWTLRKKGVCYKEEM